MLGFPFQLYTYRRGQSDPKRDHAQQTAQKIIQPRHEHFSVVRSAERLELARDMRVLCLPRFELFGYEDRIYPERDYRQQNPAYPLSEQLNALTVERQPFSVVQRMVYLPTHFQAQRRRIHYAERDRRYKIA